MKNILSYLTLFIALVSCTGKNNVSEEMKPDPKHFTVTMEAPIPNTQDVSLTPEIKLHFSRVIAIDSIDIDNPATLNNVILRDNSHKIIEITKLIDLGTNSDFIFSPKQPLSANSKYFVFVSDRIQDITKTMTTNPVSFSFTTKTISIPEVDIIKPRNRQLEVSTTPEIELIFSTQMNPDTIKANGNITLKDENNNIVAINDIIDADNNKFLFSPKAVLDAGKNYSVAINKNVTDVYGNHLNQDVVFTFTTVNKQEDIAAAKQKIIDIQKRLQNAVYSDGNQPNKRGFRSRNIFTGLSYDFNTFEGFTMTAALAAIENRINIMTDDQHLLGGQCGATANGVIQLFGFDYTPGNETIHLNTPGAMEKYLKAHINNTVLKISMGATADGIVQHALTISPIDSDVDGYFEYQSFYGFMSLAIDNNKDLSNWVNLQKGEVGHRTLDYYFFDFDSVTKTANDFEQNVNVLLNHYQTLLNHKHQLAACLDRAITYGVPGPLDEQLINLSTNLNQIILDQAGCAY